MPTRHHTYLLVHGAWHDGRVWRRVAPLLAAEGHRVLAPSLTGHGDKAHLLGPEVGLTTHVDDVVGLVLAEDLRDVILVGHSYAGMVISSVANRIPERLAGLVYVDALVPEHGETVVDVVPATRPMIEAASGGDEPWRIPPPPALPAPIGLFGVTDPDDVARLETTLGDESVRCFAEPAELDSPAQASIPRTYVLCVGSEPPGMQRKPAPAARPDGAPTRVRELRTGHDCMLTRPAELADLLLEAAAG